jgi:hypothetical protein
MYIATTIHPVGRMDMQVVYGYLTTALCSFAFFAVDFLYLYTKVFISVAVYSR